MWILRRYAFCTFTRAAAQQIPVLSRVSREKYKEKRRMKYVLVTGGVVSGLGKGVTASSIGVVLKACGLRVTSIKIDPYLNTDAGTMSPFEHGEVFVLDDGGEKTKPTQHSVRELRALGLIPHFLACRSAQPLVENAKQKLSQFCHVPVANILNIHDVPNIWHVPLLLRNQSAHDAILKQLDLLSVARHVDLQEWTRRAETSDNITKSVRIAMVGKYVGLTDSYLSVVKALMHACIACSLKPSIDWIAASDLEDDSAKLTPEAHAAAWKNLRGAACVLVPGGFGDRGVKGMILAARYARENSVPFLGICLGMQISVIEFARSVLHLDKANSEEFDPQTPDRVVIFMPEGSKTHMGSTMRLGSRRTLFQTPDCIAAKLYNNSEYVDERHRHRYEVNPDIVGSLEEAGLKFVGRDESGKRMEILELQDHPFYIGVQFHPEFKSRPGRPSAPFLGLVLAATGQLEAFVKRQQNGNV
ncbi:uncharacterized protein LOC132608747 isoform X8 [Lycium barbarum]|uniref:uncharacterized protein LOC132608747 isoform X8 n=1 Tax=Lycium barbarum TaxID=112863 RepID=UPI00293EDE85|nr:uncharacterized protein LOC132608747 isoform X8 [Lycium barbarum]